jgi:hypothetical protein
MTPRSLRWWIRQLHKVWQCSWGDRWLLMQAVSGLGVARLAVLTLPLRWIAPFLGHYMQESPATDRPAQQTMVMRVSWAVCTMSRYTPWESTCLAQAIAAKRMLQRLQIPSTLYLGVARNDAGGGGGPRLAPERQEGRYRGARDGSIYHGRNICRGRRGHRSPHREGDDETMAATLGPSIASVVRLKCRYGSNLGGQGRQPIRAGRYGRYQRTVVTTTSLLPGDA